MAVPLFDPVTRPVPSLVTAIAAEPLMSASTSVPSATIEPVIAGMRASARVPLVILEAARFGTRAASRVPDVTSDAA